MTLEQLQAEGRREFEEKFLYWVVLGSTLNDGSELRWNVGEGKMPSIEDILSLQDSLIARAFEAGKKELLDQQIEWVKGMMEKNQEVSEYYSGHNSAISKTLAHLNELRERLLSNQK